MIQAIKDKIVIKQDEAVKVSGVFIVPESSQQKPKQGTVVSVGEEVLYLKVGDKVLYEQYIGAPVNVDSEELLIMLEKNVYCKL